MRPCSSVSIGWAFGRLCLKVCASVFARERDYPAIAQLAEKMSHCVAVGAVVRASVPLECMLTTSPVACTYLDKAGLPLPVGRAQRQRCGSQFGGVDLRRAGTAVCKSRRSHSDLIPCVPEWGEHVGTILRRWDHVREFRQLFVFYKDEFRDVGLWSGRLYPRFALKRLDAESISSLGGEIEQAVLDAWGSTDQFAKHGFGYYILESDKLASYCISTAFDGHSVEVYVRTIPEYRRKGLGTAVCSAFIRQCLSNGLTPSWECSWTNSAASSLARRVAFRSAKNVPVYKFHVY